MAGRSNPPPSLATVYFEYKILRGPVYSYGKAQHIVLNPGGRPTCSFKIEGSDVDMDMEVFGNAGAKNRGKNPAREKANKGGS